MSFLDELKKKKGELKGTETVVTREDGTRYVEGEERVAVESAAYGFVVDTRPDCEPAMVAAHLYLGSQDCAADDILKKYDIRYVLSLGVDTAAGSSGGDVSFKFVELLDTPESELRAVLGECLRWVRAAAGRGRNVLVHCNAGVSRAAAVAAAYLMHYERMTYEDAYRQLKARRPAVRPNDGFRRQLLYMTPGHII